MDDVFEKGVEIGDWKVITSFQGGVRDGQQEVLVIISQDGISYKASVF
jgi:hypothetical protein